MHDFVVIVFVFRPVFNVIVQLVCECNNTTPFRSLLQSVRQKSYKDRGPRLSSWEAPKGGGGDCASRVQNVETFILSLKGGGAGGTRALELTTKYRGQYHSNYVDWCHGPRALR